MAKYAFFLGKRVDVHYRAGDVPLPATGTLMADSGRSIFLEEQFFQGGKVKMFRWEIPYPCVLRVNESAAREMSAQPYPDRDAEKDASKGAREIRLRRRLEEN